MNNSNSNPKFIATISNILGIISSLIAIIPFLFACFTNSFYYYIIDVIFLVTAILLAKNHRHISKSILKFIMRSTCTNRAYKLKRKTITFEYITRNTMEHSRIFNVIVLHDGLTEILDKYKWTASQELTPDAIFDNQEIVKLDKKIGMQRYAIKFKNAQRYNKHDTVPKMGMKITNMIDEKGEASPHLSSGIFEITDLLILHVIFDNSLEPKNIRKLEYLHYSDDNHYSCENVNYTRSDENKKEVIWEIKNPIYGGKYMIDWSF